MTRRERILANIRCAREHRRQATTHAVRYLRQVIIAAATALHLR